MWPAPVAATVVAHRPRTLGQVPHDEASGSSYNWSMNTTHSTPTTFIDALVARDFDRLADTLAPNAVMRGLVPMGPQLWEGREEVAARFRHWFGGTDEIAALDHTLDAVGGRARLTWHFRLRQAWLGDTWHAIAQHAFLDVGPDGRIERIDLLCSGFIAEQDNVGTGGSEPTNLAEVGS